MGNDLVSPPLFSTPDTRISESPATRATGPTRIRSDEELSVVYEIGRTVQEIQKGRWRRVALQFPDSLLQDAPRVFELIRHGLRAGRGPEVGDGKAPSVRRKVDNLQISKQDSQSPKEERAPEEYEGEERLYILGDTSYGACCIDEITAEHVDADVVVHYGRACLSPTARLPVIHIFTIQDLPIDPVVHAFMQIHTHMDSKVILMADVTYVSHLPTLAKSLRDIGYNNIYETTVKHDPGSPLPNRTIPPEAIAEPAELRSWAVFHISSPPPALLLTLYSRVSFIHIYSTSNPSQPTQPLLASTTTALRRRYALLTRLSRASIIGILINTLSVHAYQEALAGAKARIEAAGKKAYVFALGQLNAAKISNFAEVGGWVVIGCWESSLIDGKEFEKPVVAPFELELALQGDGERIWTGEWRGDFGAMVDSKSLADKVYLPTITQNGTDNGPTEDGLDSEGESEPPEFDLRTGRYISHSKPMRKALASPLASQNGETSTANSLVRRARGELALVGGELSPGAQYLQEKASWKGLGSDFKLAYEDDGDSSGNIVEGRTGIASGYVGEADGEGERKAIQ